MKLERDKKKNETPKRNCILLQQNHTKKEIKKIERKFRDKILYMTKKEIYRENIM